MKITDYRIVQKQDIEELEDTVAKLIKDGWHPVGGMSIQPLGEGEALYFQAMVEADSDSVIGDLESKLDDVISAIDSVRRAVKSQ